MCEIIFKTIINRKGTSTSIKRNIDLSNILSGLQRLNSSGLKRFKDLIIQFVILLRKNKIKYN